MIEKNKSSENQTPIFPDVTLYDIDIDFELNDGKGAWVLILRRDGHHPQFRADSDGNM